MQSLQLHLTGVARSWLSKLERERQSEVGKSSQSNLQATSSQHTNGQH
jgi:hypothetical protein